MKSVGESLAIGRTFLEALNKAIRACEFGFAGLEDLPAVDDDEIERIISTLHPRRIFGIYTKLKRRGASALSEIEKRTGYNRWFLSYMLEQLDLESRLAKGPLDENLILEAKRMGLSDHRIATLSGRKETEIREMRETFDLHAVFHFVDTCSGEFEAQTPYFYSTYGETDEGGATGGPAVVILASGPNRIGQGLEFDTCCTLSSLAYRSLGVKSIIINSNPETVSTDFNVSDRLYLEPLTVEDVKEVLRKEQARDVVVQLGGQTPLNMAEELETWGARVVGTSVKSITDAEDRKLFSALMERIGVKQPANRSAGSAHEVEELAESIGFPILLRPSFVLGGRSMMIAFNIEELRDFLDRGMEVSPKKPVLVDQFLEDAFEYDVDALCDGENVYIAGIMQHIEAAGVHSGDSACVFPAYKAEPSLLAQMSEATARIARSIGVIGFLNIQFASIQNDLYILEVNPRASRTVPFISKASGVNLVEAAVRIWHGEDLRSQGLTNESQTGLPGVGIGECIVGWAVKEAMFSFDRFREVDPLLGPEMRSTGEVIGIGESFGEAYAKAQMATGARLPSRGRVFVTVHDQDKPTILPIIKELESLGFMIAATRGTAEFLFKNGVFSEVILKVHEGSPHIIDHMHAGRIQLIINTPLGRYTQRDDDYIRINAVRRRIPYTTTTSAARAAVEGIRYMRRDEVRVHPLPDTVPTGRSAGSSAARRY